MKKLMIGVLVLIPIVILLIVQAVSVVVSSRTHIGVESISLDKTEIELSFEDGIFDFNSYLKPTVLPERATDKTVTWSIADLEPLDADYAAKLKDYLENGDKPEYTGEIVAPPATMVDENGNAVESNTTGAFRLYSYCSFYVEAQAETMKARCLVYVGGYSLERVSVGGKNSVAVGESTLLGATYYPIDSIVTDVVWTSDNPSVLTVDANGGVTGKSVGVANVTARAISPDQDEYVSSAAFEVTVTASASALGGSLYLHQQSLPLSVLGLSAADVTTYENAVLESGADGDAIRIVDQNLPANVTTASGTVNLLPCEENDIVIANYSLYRYDADAEDNFVLAVGEVALKLSAVWRSSLIEGAPQNVVWKTDKESVAKVDSNGNVTAIKRGVFTVTATVGEGENAESASITLFAQNKVSTLQLNVTDSFLSEGLARETVFASQKYTNETRDTLAPCALSIIPVRPKAPEEETEFNAFIDSFTFEVFETAEGVLVPTDKAVFRGGVLTFVPEKITERTSLTVRVSAKYPKYETLKEYTVKEFTLVVTDGIEVDSYACLVKVASTDKDIVFVENVKMLDGDETPFTGHFQGSVKIKNSVWGNNCMFSAANRQMFEYSGLFEVIDDDVTISNLTIRCNKVEDEITDANGTAGLSGKCIGLGCHTYSSNRILQNQRIEFCILENGGGCLNVWGANTTIEGCIMRNTSGVAVYVATERAGSRLTYSQLVVKNCIMSNMVGTGFSFPYSHYSDVSAEQIQADLAAGRNSTFIQQGFLDMYNWQSIDIMNLLDIDSLDEKLSGAINAFARNEFASNPALKPYYSRYNGVDYFHMGFLSNGLTEPTYLQPQLEDKRFVMITTDILTIDLIKRMSPVKFWGYMGNETSIVPGSTYSVVKQIAKLHGEY